MSWAGLEGEAVLVRDSPAETRRFGHRIARLVVGRDSAPGPAVELAFAEALRGSDADLVVCRWPGQRTGLAAVALSTGRAILPADTLIYWESPAAGLASISPSGDLRVEVPSSATARVAEVLAAVISDSFRGYGNHYSANPLLDDDLALQGYVEWALGAFEEAPHNVVLLLDGDDPVGVATLTRDGGDLEVELAGLVSSAQGRGGYATLLRGVGRHAVALGCERVIISTQAHNHRVQRAWARAGFKPFATVTTVHAMTPELWASSHPGG